MRKHMHTSMTKGSPMLLNNLCFAREKKNKCFFFFFDGVGWGRGITVLKTGPRAQAAPGPSALAAPEPDTVLTWGH